MMDWSKYSIEELRWDFGCLRDGSDLAYEILLEIRKRAQVWMALHGAGVVRLFRGGLRRGYWLTAYS